jgi:hypothetical protein
MIESKLPHVGTTIFTRMSALAAESGAINLSQGFPDFDAPAPLLPVLREQIAAQVLRQRGVHCDPETEITVVPGATEGIFCAVTASIRPGDEVIMLRQLRAGRGTRRRQGRAPAAVRAGLYRGLAAGRGCDLATHPDDHDQQPAQSERQHPE